MPELVLAHGPWRVNLVAEDKKGELNREEDDEFSLDLDFKDCSKSARVTWKISSSSDAGKPVGKEASARKPRCTGLSALSKPRKRGFWRSCVEDLRNVLRSTCRHG